MSRCTAISIIYMCTQRRQINLHSLIRLPESHGEHWVLDVHGAPSEDFDLAAQSD